MAEFLLFCMFMLSMVGWIIIYAGMGILRFLGICPYACFNTKCPWKFFCKRFITLAYNIEHTQQMLKNSENKKKAQMLIRTDETDETQETVEADKSEDDA